jgi:NADH dehydrogenase [ubiquinone] 1 alpha subcomplex assembly factor 5
MDQPEIFDRALRRLRRDRAAARFDDHAFLVDAIIDSLLDRLDLVARCFGDALDLGCHDGRLGRQLAARGIAVTSADAGHRFARMAGGVQCDEDRLPFADASFDLVVSAGVLDQVNDLPGALALIRRVLRPDGLLLAGFVGGHSVARLRAAMLAADIEADRQRGGGVPQRFHPRIDVAAAGNLLSRAGFALPVADSERLTLRYGDPFRALADLRGMAATNLLIGQRPPALDRTRLAHLASAFRAARDPDGKTGDEVELVFLTGWAPGPDQPQPARRGSATRSLADALRRPEQT